MKFLVFIPVFILFFSTLFSQETNNINSTDRTSEQWYLNDPVTDSVAGISLHKALKYVENRKTKTVVVAVIDSGVDFEHEDLASNIWVNDDEIDENGIDDDENGYIDDIHGWNFLGTADGENVTGVTLELTRLYAEYKKRFDGADINALSKEEKKEYKYYLVLEKAFLAEIQDKKDNISLLNNLKESFVTANLILEGHLKNDTFNKKDLEGITTANNSVMWAKTFVLNMIEQDITVEKVGKWIQNELSVIETKLNPKNFARSIIGDDLNDITDSIYGNNDYNGGTAGHGTSVAGIIGAVRNNGIGIDGICPDIKIMIIRVVPGGDEYDKDVALGIRYAVNNGAQVINCSFGKAWTSNKQMVDDAIKYAEANNVLIVHASGNEGVNNDIITHYPTAVISDDIIATNFIEIGASTINTDKELPASFSNYGKVSVDAFAPGEEIITLSPKNKYGTPSGTSVAAPVVSGVAALLLAYFPELTPPQIITILTMSVTDYSKQKVKIPGKNGKTKKFRKICRSGGVINAFEAVKMADDLQTGSK